MIGEAMGFDELFDLLDLDADDALSRTELHRAARLLGWHWREAPLYAVLDLLTLRPPLSRARFAACMDQMARDPLGPFGAVLRKCSPVGREGGANKCSPVGQAQDPAPALAERRPNLAAPVEELADPLAALALPVEERALSPRQAALLVIDPQRSFTSGSWMRSIGADGRSEVEPIRLAFARVASLLGSDRRLEVVLTRCPFPPDSYDWDQVLDGIIEPDRPYFIKPGNSVLWPPDNGFADWLDRLLGRGRRVLVIGGCTLNSCVRVSAIETQQIFGQRGLQVVVDLELCGARLANYQPGPQYGGVSSVESAVRQMLAGGVDVARRVRWR